MCDAQDNLKLSGIVIPNMLSTNSDNNKVQRLHTLASKAYMQECSKYTVEDLLKDENFEFIIPDIVKPNLIQIHDIIKISFVEPDEKYGILMNVFKDIRHFKKNRHHFFFCNNELIREFVDSWGQWTKYIINEHYIVKKSQPARQWGLVDCDIFTIATKQLFTHTLYYEASLRFSKKNPHVLFCSNGNKVIKIRCDTNTIKEFSRPKWNIRKLYQTSDNTKHLIQVYTERLKAQLYYLDINTMRLKWKAYDKHPIACNAQGTRFVFCNSEYLKDYVELLIFNQENFKTPLVRLRIPRECFSLWSSKIAFLNDSCLLISDSLYQVDPKIRIYCLETKQQIACYRNTLKLHKFKMIKDQLVAYTHNNGLGFISWPLVHVLDAYKQVQERISQAENSQLKLNQCTNKLS